MAKDHLELVGRGLSIKKVGNRIVSIVGGRAIHPVSPRVGGFSRAPRAHELDELRAPLDAAIAEAQETVALVAGLETPPSDREPRLVSLVHPSEYPMNEGRITSSDGIDLAPSDWRDAFHEGQVPWSHALQAHAADGVPYLLGPTARVFLAADQLHPIARAALDSTGISAEGLRRNVFRSIVARAVELLHALAEARDIVADYRPPAVACAPWQPRAGIAAWATEAPRGLLFHRYRLNADGRVREAQIVPPTSQNQAAIEHDLALFAPEVLDLPHDEATRRLEQLIRSYDPCISCATHFLQLRIERDR
jgi:coenzyme F420-reducing hydrogenase alpha subunit